MESLLIILAVLFVTLLPALIKFVKDVKIAYAIKRIEKKVEACNTLKELYVLRNEIVQSKYYLIFPDYCSKISNEIMRKTYVLSKDIFNEQ